MNHVYFFYLVDVYNYSPHKQNVSYKKPMFDDNYEIDDDEEENIIKNKPYYTSFYTNNNDLKTSNKIINSILSTPIDENNDDELDFDDKFDNNNQYIPHYDKIYYSDNSFKEEESEIDINEDENIIKSNYYESYKTISNHKSPYSISPRSKKIHKYCEEDNKYNITSKELEENISRSEKLLKELELKYK